MPKGNLCFLCATSLLTACGGRSELDGLSTAGAVGGSVTSGGTHSTGQTLPWVGNSLGGSRSASGGFQGSGGAISGGRSPIGGEFSLGGVPALGGTTSRTLAFGGSYSGSGSPSTGGVLSTGGSRTSGDATSSDGSMQDGGQNDDAGLGGNNALQCGECLAPSVEGAALAIPFSKVQFYPLATSIIGIAWPPDAGSIDASSLLVIASTDSVPCDYPYDRQGGNACPSYAHWIFSFIVPPGFTAGKVPSGNKLWTSAPPLYGSCFSALTDLGGTLEIESNDGTTLAFSLSGTNGWTFIPSFSREYRAKICQ